MTSPQRVGRGVQKMIIWVDFVGITGGDKGKEVGLEILKLG